MRAINKFSTFVLAAAVTCAAQSTSGATGTSGTTQTSTTTQNSASHSSTASPTRSNRNPVVVSGTEVQIRVNEALSSDKSISGDRFTGVLETPVMDSEGHTLFQRGATVQGRVLDAKASGRLSESGELQLTLTQISSSDGYINVNSQPYLVKGESHSKSNTTKIGGGAVLGAILGGIVGGGKGAAVGATAGAGAGAGAAAATGKKEAKLDPESRVSFVLTSDATMHTGEAPTPPDPVLQKRDGTSVGESSSTSGSSASNSSSSGSRSTNSSNGPWAGNSRSTSSGSSASDSPVDSGPVDNGPPVLRRRDEKPVDDQQSASASGPTSSPTSSTQSGNSTSTNSSAQVSANTANAFTGFSLRDRRVITQCLSSGANAAKVTAEPLPAGVSLQAGSVLPASISRKVHPLPLECNQQLSPTPNDQERTYYNRTVMLLDANGKILDAFLLGAVD